MIFRRRPYMRRVRQRFKEQTRFLIAWLKQRPCQDCGGTFPPECMDFDHRPGTTKRFGISNGQHYNWPTLLAEVEKCDLVCANCHRTRTWQRRQAR